MIAVSRMAKFGAVAAAFLVHGALAMALMQADEVEIEGGAGAPEAQLGTSFADMAAGTLEAEETADAAELSEAETANEPLQPEAAEHVPPDNSAPTPTPPEQILAALAPSLTSPVEAITPDLPPDVPAAEQANPAPQPEEAARAPVEEVLEFEPEPSSVVSKSLRPKQRSDTFEEAHQRVPAKPKPTDKARAKPKPKAAPKPKVQPAQRGNAEQNAVAGAATGSAEAKASASGTSGAEPKASGNAAASNYPGLVMRKIAQVPRPRVGSRGTAVVGFSVGSGGGLASVHLAGSSGSAPLDQAALHMVRAAAPFPAPPPGAQRSFTISIKGR